MKKIYFFFSLILIVVAIGVKAQEAPFWNEIQEFKKQDSLNPPPANGDVFVGSSSFRKWTDLQDYFPYYPVINRGFGGSTIPDVIRYANDVIIPYHPREVLIYAGDNDLASGDTVTAFKVYQRFKELFDVIRTQLPQTYIVFVSIKPSPSRERLMPRMVVANKLIKSFIEKQPHAYFVDVYTPMLDEKGKPRQELFLEDNLHMNEKGYAIWKTAIKPYLLR